MSDLVEIIIGMDNPECCTNAQFVPAYRLPAGKQGRQASLTPNCTDKACLVSNSQLKMKHTIQFFLLSIMIILYTSCDSKSKRLNYPETRQVDTVDQYFGQTVADPYRWLEDDRSPETEAWVKAQNKVTEEYLSRIPFRDTIRKRLTQVWNYKRQGTPVRKGDYWFVSRNNGLQNQSVLYVKKGENGEERVLLDPNTLSDDGTVAMANYAFSENGKYVAYAISRGGSDWQEVFVKEVESGEALNDHLEWVKFSGISWLKDQGFYYSRYDAPAQGEELTDVNEYQQVVFHKLGDPQSADRLIYKDNDHARRNYGAQVDDDGRRLLVSGSESTSNNSLIIKAIGDEAAWQIADTTFENESSYLGTVHKKYWILTNNEASRYRVIEMDPEKPALENWKEIIPENDHVLQGVYLTKSFAVALYMVDAESHLEVYNLKGVKQYNLDLPAPGSVSSIETTREDDVVFFNFTSYAVPGRVYRCDLNTKDLEVYFEPDVDFDGNRYETSLVFVEADDGARIPLHIVHKKGITLDGSNPTLLYGYGGFNIVYQPRFDVRLVPWLENGGVYVNAHIRGGGEYGEDWHLAGTKLNKQRVFDDFILVAEELIRMGYTNHNRLAIKGGSNGGLLVGAVVNQRPDLFQVALPAVGVMDMLRYHLFTIGWAWAGDYGRSDDNEEMFRYLYGYSPLHNIRSDVEYPATLVFTADHDDRVVPAHSFKYIATLQEKYKGDNPVLIRIETKAGHGAGKPVSKQIEEVTDEWAFTFYNMGITPY